jgi:hypothetical protein
VQRHQMQKYKNKPKWLPIQVDLDAPKMVKVWIVNTTMWILKSRKLPHSDHLEDNCKAGGLKLISKFEQQ